MKKYKHIKRVQRNQKTRIIYQLRKPLSIKIDTFIDYFWMPIKHEFDDKVDLIFLLPKDKYKKFELVKLVTHLESGTVTLILKDIDEAIEQYSRIPFDFLKRPIKMSDGNGTITLSNPLPFPEERFIELAQKYLQENANQVTNRYDIKVSFINEVTIRIICTNKATNNYSSKKRPGHSYEDPGTGLVTQISTGQISELIEQISQDFTSVVP